MKSTARKAGKIAVLPRPAKRTRHERSRAALSAAIVYAGWALEKVRAAQVVASVEDPLLAMVLTGQIECAAKMKVKLVNIAVCLEVKP